MDKEAILSFIEAATGDDLAAIMKAMQAKQDDIDKVRIAAEIDKVIKESQGEQRFVIGYLDDECCVETRKGTILANDSAILDPRNYEAG